MEKRVTIKDIALRVGVSPMTVSKALNRKPQVSEKKRELILETAREMNYIPNASAKRLIQKEKKIAAIFPENPAEFYSYVEEGIRRAEQELVDSKCRVGYYPYSSLDSVGEVSRCIRQALDDGMDGLVLTGNHHYEEYRGALDCVIARKIPVLYNTICGKFQPGIIGSVRLNSELAGRVAADFHALYLNHAPVRRAKIAIFVGDKSVSVHMDCVKGYLENARKYGMEIVGIYETHEDKTISYRLTGEVLAAYPDLGGIYISSYNAVGVCDWLSEHGRQEQVIAVGHDLYPELAQRMKAGALKASLFQNQFEYGRESIYIMLEYLNGLRAEKDCTKIKIPRLVTRSMLPYFPEYTKFTVEQFD